MKKFFAFALTFALVMNLLTATVSASDPTTVRPTAGFQYIEGIGEVPDVIVDVELYTDLAFYLNPFQSPAITRDFTIINRTANTSVLAAYYLRAVVADGVQLQNIAAANTNENFAPLDLIATGRLLTLAIDTGSISALIPTGANATAAPTFADGFDAEITYEGDQYGVEVTNAMPAPAAATGLPADAGAAARVIEFTAAAETGTTEGQARVGFALRGATDVDATATPVTGTLAAANAGVAAFSLAGFANSNAPWQTGDVEILGTLWLTPINDGAFGTGAPLAGLTANVNRIPDANVPDLPAPTLGFHNATAPGHFIRTAQAMTIDLTVDNAGSIVIPFVGATAGNFHIFYGATDFTGDATASSTAITIPTAAADAWRGLPGPTHTATIHIADGAGGFIPHALTFTY